MPPKIALTMRTADRSPKRNYFGATYAGLLEQGVASDEINVYSTEPDARGLDQFVSTNTKVHAPSLRLTANQNGLAQISVLEHVDADWIVMTEDDLEWCDDPIGSMTRWLEEYERPGISVYRFFAFGPLKPWKPFAATAKNEEMKGSQAVAMRANDARRFRTWAEMHPTDWRPKGAPFQDRPHDGFDKLIGYWALRDMKQPANIVSVPFFCRHVGVESSIHGWGKRMDHQFAGRDWRYEGAACLA